MSRKKGFYAGLAVYALLFSGWKAWPEAHNLDNSSVFVSVISDGVEEVPALRDIVFESVVIELKQIGYTTYPALSDDGKPDSVFQRAVEAQASSLILVTYATEEDNVALILTLFGVREQAEKASVMMASEIDLSLDVVIGESVRTLVGKSGIDPPVAPDRIDEATSPGGEVALSTDEPTVRLDPVETTRPAEVSHSYFNVSAGLAPFFAMASTRDYFTLGIEPGLRVGLNFKAPLKFLQVGLLVKMMQFNAQGVLLDTSNYLISAGPDVRFIISPSDTFGVYVHAAGGASAFVLSNEKIGVYWKIVPFAAGGCGMFFKTGAMFGLTVNADYSVYFEKSIFIMGISPAVYAVFSF